MCISMRLVLSWMLLGIILWWSGIDGLRDGGGLSLGGVNLSAIQRLQQPTIADINLAPLGGGDVGEVTTASQVGDTSSEVGEQTRVVGQVLQWMRGGIVQLI